MRRLLISLIISLLAAVPALSQRQDIKVITGATLIDGTARPPIKDAVIIIRGARIEQVGAKIAIPKDAEVIDARGKFIIPGLADMHHHLANGSLNFAQQNFRKNLAQLLASGVTTVLNLHIDLKSFADLKSASSGDTSPYPRFFSVGRGFGTIGGYRPQTPDDARAAVLELKAASVDAVKLAYDDLSWLSKQSFPLLKPDVMAAIIDEAHKQNLKVYVHAPILKYAKEVLRAGADGLVHGIISDPIDEEFIALMKKNGAVYIATLALFEDCADLAAWTRRLAAYDERGMIAKSVYETLLSPATARQWEAINNNSSYTKERMPVLRANLKKLFDAGVPIVTGTDTGFPGVLLGVSSQIEMKLHVEAGLKPQAVILAATINAARMIGRERELGSVESGKLADLLILDQDPLADIGNVRHIHRVIKGGVVHDPMQLLRAAK
ncbi:MAG: amidohydrolase family protein [Acidobacteriota bacterium]